MPGFSDPLKQFQRQHQKEKEKKQAAEKAKAKTDPKADVGPRSWGSNLRNMWDNRPTDIGAQVSARVAAAPNLTSSPRNLLSKVPSLSKDSKPSKPHSRQNTADSLDAGDSPVINQSVAAKRKQNAKNAKQLYEPFTEAPALPVFSEAHQRMLRSDWELTSDDMGWDDDVTVGIPNTGYEAEGIPFLVGSFTMTQYRVGLFLDNPTLGFTALHVPNGLVERISVDEITNGKRRYRLTVHTKDWRSFRFYFVDSMSQQRAQQMLNFYCFSQLPGQDAAALEASRSMGATIQDDDEVQFYYEHSIIIILLDVSESVGL